MKTRIIIATLGILATNLSMGGDASVNYALKKRIPLTTNCSGCAYRPETKTFFIIDNHWSDVYEITSDIRIINVYQTGLKGEDTEDIAYAGDGIFYVCAEHNNTIYKLKFENGKFTLKKSAALDLPNKMNKNLEGIVFCPARNSLFCVKEKYPSMLVEVEANEENFGQIRRKIEVENIKDLSGVTYDEENNTLLLLSDESKCVLIYDIESLQEKSRFPVKGRQPEGICFGEKGVLCVISEPADCFFYQSESAQKENDKK